MGTLDDAIREHLELKRRKGASEEEIQRKEAEAFGRGQAPPPAPSPDALDDAPAAADLPHIAGQNGASGDAGDSAGYDPGATGRTELEPERAEPDEVLPSDSLEPEMPHTDEPHPRSAEPPPPVPEIDDRRQDDEPEGWSTHDRADGDEDVLEETPEFLEDTPEHDRLWFEQKPPKDFDFD